MVNKKNKINKKIPPVLTSTSGVTASLIAALTRCTFWMMHRNARRESAPLYAQVHTEWRSSGFYFCVLTPPHPTQHLLLTLFYLLCGGFSKSQSVRWWGAGVKHGDGGPSRVPALLGSALSYAGNTVGSGRFVLVRCTDGICAAQRHWWGLRWCSVIPAEGSSTSSPGRAQHPQRKRERGGYDTCHVDKRGKVAQ